MKRNTRRICEAAMTRPALGRIMEWVQEQQPPTPYLKQLHSNLAGQIILVSLTSTEWGVWVGGQGFRKETLEVRPSSGFLQWNHLRVTLGESPSPRRPSLLSFPANTFKSRN